MTRPLPLATDPCICEHTRGQHIATLPMADPCTAPGCPCEDFLQRNGIPGPPTLLERLRAAVDAYRNPTKERT